MALPIDLKSYRRSLVQFWPKYRSPVLGVVAALVLGAGAFLGYQHFMAGSDEERRRVSDAQPRDLAQAFSSGFQREREALSRLFDEAELARLLAGGSADARAAAESELAAKREDILKVWLLRAGSNQVDYSSRPPLGYAALDMLRQSESTGEAPEPAVLLGGEDQHLAVLHRVNDISGDLAGHALFAVDVSVVQKAMSTVEFDRMYGEILQGALTVKPLVLASRGEKSLRQGSPTFTVGVSGTPWTLAVWDASAAAASSESEAPVPLWALGGVALVLLAGGYVVLKRRKAAPEATGSTASITVRASALAEKLAALRRSGTIPPPAESGPEGDLVDVPPADAIEVIEDVESEETTDAEAIPASVFRAYDVRGVVGKALTAEAIEQIGRAIGSEADARSLPTIVVGSDGRRSSPELRQSLIKGLRASGRDVIDVGSVPTPILYFATYYLNTGSGVMVTGSHNPPEYNGLKIMLGGETLFGESIIALRERIQSGNLESGEGSLQTMEVVDEYIRRVTEDIPVALGNAFKIVVDCGNGIAGDVAPKLFRALGHDVIELYCEVDGSFPNHPPDTSQPENLADLIEAVKEHEADLGFAFDGDGDRLGIVDGKGNILWADRQMMLYARDVLSRNAGAQIVYDVKCTSRLGKIIQKLGGEPVMWKTGHSFIKDKMKESGALLAGEMSGHIFFKERWYGFDDAMYAGARMLEILLDFKQPPAAVFAKLPGGISTPELRVDFPEGEHLAFMERLLQGTPFSEARLTTIDGVRADYPDGWGLVRASNTTPSLVLRFEADDSKALKRIQEEFRSVLLGLDPELALPF